jgi:nucleotide-binding universal stress UspA family protein
MKKILVAVDFSDCSINALEHAISIANKAKAGILMVWVNKPETSKEMFTEGPEVIASLVQDRFEEIAGKYRKDVYDGQISYKIKQGKVFREIVVESEDPDVMMIVAGTHGASGFEEFWIGSNAYRMVSSVKKPIITIRGGIKIKRDLKKIVMPIDSTMETRQKVPFTAYLADLFGAEVHVLSIYMTKVKAIMMRVDKYSEQVVKHLEEENVKYVQKGLFAENLADTTIDYAKEIDANLISIMTEQEKTTSNLWLGPYAAQMVNHSPIPVLCIHPKEFLISLAR